MGPNPVAGASGTGSGGGGGGSISGAAGGSGVVILRIGSPSPPLSSFERSLPAPWLQSVGRLASAEACEPGWSPSWALWMNSGQGGWVCNREIVWDSSIGAWQTR